MFVAEYVIDFNQTRAYKVTYNSSDDNNACVGGNRILRLRKVNMAIEQAVKDVFSPNIIKRRFQALTHSDDESIQLRALELLAKCLNMFSDHQQVATQIVIAPELRPRLAPAVESVRVIPPVVESDTPGIPADTSMIPTPGEPYDYS